VRQMDDHDACGAQPMASCSVDSVGASANRPFQHFQSDSPVRLSSDTAAAIRGCGYISTLSQHAYCASPAADAARRCDSMLC